MDFEFGHSNRTAELEPLFGDDAGLHSGFARAFLEARSWRPALRCAVLPCTASCCAVPCCTQLPLPWAAASLSRVPTTPARPVLQHAGLARGQGLTGQPGGQQQQPAARHLCLWPLHGRRGGPAGGVRSADLPEPADGRGAGTCGQRCGQCGQCSMRRGAGAAPTRCHRSRRCLPQAPLVSAVFFSPPQVGTSAYTQRAAQVLNSRDVRWVWQGTPCSALPPACCLLLPFAAGLRQAGSPSRPPFLISPPPTRLCCSYAQDIITQAPCDPSFVACPATPSGLLGAVRAAAGTRAGTAGTCLWRRLLPATMPPPCNTLDSSAPSLPAAGRARHRH